MSFIPRSYTLSKLKLFPVKVKKVNLKKIVRSVSKKILCNYDAFEADKKVIPYEKKKKKESRGGSQLSHVEYSPPVYIGQNVYIRPGYVVSIPEFSYSHSYTSEAFNANKKNLLDNEHSGIISRKADKKIRSAVNWLLCSATPKKVYRKKTNSWFEFKVNFITLTLPDTEKKITDFQFKTKLLNPFLTYMRKFHGLKNYVWKIEFQKNGKLHLHLTTDTFIHHAKIRSCWNGLLGANNWLIDFAKKFGHTNPPSTDVHSVRKIRNLGAYIAKYMSKNSEDLKDIKGRIWGCNYEISRANKTQVFIDRNEAHIQLRPLMSKKIEYTKMQIVNKKTGLLQDRGEIFYLTMSNWLNDLSGCIREKFFETILGLKNLYHDGTLFTDLAVV